MARRVRSFVFETSGLRHISKRLMEGLHIRGEALPEYAGTVQKVAEVIVEHVDRKPTQIILARGCYREFDQEGRLMPARFTGETGTWRLSDAALKQVAAMIWEAGAAFPMLNAQKS